MDVSHQPNQQRVADPIYRKLHRAFFALCILLAPVVLSFWFALCPAGVNDAACPDMGSSLAVFADFRAMNPQLMQIFLFLSLIVPHLYALSYVGLGMLAMKRSPWLATLGIICGFAAGIVWAVIADSVMMLSLLSSPMAPSSPPWTRGAIFLCIFPGDSYTVFTGKRMCEA